jgi:hypothetical protein
MDIKVTDAENGHWIAQVFANVFQRKTILTNTKMENMAVW